MLLSGPRAEMKVPEPCASSEEGQLGQGDLAGMATCLLMCLRWPPLCNSLLEFSSHPPVSTILLSLPRLCRI